jgi:hypothetical protein
MIRITKLIFWGGLPEFFYARRYHALMERMPGQFLTVTHIDSLALKPRQQSINHLAPPDSVPVHGRQPLFRATSPRATFPVSCPKKNKLTCRQGQPIEQ